MRQWVRDATAPVGAGRQQQQRTGAEYPWRGAIEDDNAHNGRPRPQSDLAQSDLAQPTQRPWTILAAPQQHMN